MEQQLKTRLQMLVVPFELGSPYSRVDLVAPPTLGDNLGAPIKRDQTGNDTSLM